MTPAQWGRHNALRGIPFLSSRKGKAYHDNQKNIQYARGYLHGLKLQRELVMHSLQQKLGDAFTEQETT